MREATTVQDELSLALLPSRHYERNQQQQQQHLCFSRFVKAMMVAVSVPCLFVVYQICSLEVTSTKMKQQRPKRHTIPTQLSIVDPETNEYVDALTNPLYQTLLKGTEFHGKAKPNTFLRSNDNVLPFIRLDKTVMDKLRQPLTVTWSLGKSSLDDTPLVDPEKGVLALYCPSDAPHEAFLEAATLKQIRVTHLKHSRNNNDNDNTWFIPNFPITQHETCRFRLFGPGHYHWHRDDGTNRLRLWAVSPMLELPRAASTPTNVHLAFAHDPSEMVLQFRTGQAGTPIAEYNPVGNGKQTKATGTSHTYQASDMCQAPANVTEVGKFQDPGMLHVVRLHNLQPNQLYQYRVGLASGQGIVWSDIHSFRSAPPVGDGQEVFSYLVYGDQGCPAVGWGRGGLWTSAMAAREKDHLRAVHHFGDLSYARGAAHIWEEWFHMLEPLTVRVPLMIGIGNHEYDHTAGGEHGKDPSGATDPFMPSWGNYGMDSGGECGVPASKRFTMPTSKDSNGVFWYSHDYATVHTIMISTEHNLTRGSLQYEWLKADLEAVNRTRTPWLVVEMHRPMYESEFVWWETKVCVGIRHKVEDLLYEHRVDLVLSGHFHAYLRTCDGLYRSKCHQEGAPTYITVGSAGAILEPTVLYPQHWTEKFIRMHFGYGRITIHNASAMHFAFVRAGATNNPHAGLVEDDTWILRNRP